VASGTNDTPADDTHRGTFVQTPTWIMDLVADEDSDITATHVFVWQTIRRHRSKARPMPWPSQPTIAREAGLKSRSAANQIISELETVGALRRHQRPGHSCRYELAEPDGPPLNEGVLHRGQVLSSTEDKCVFSTEDTELEPLELESENEVATQASQAVVPKDAQKLEAAPTSESANDTFLAQARHLCDLAFEQTPKPVQKRVAVHKLIEAELRAGTEPHVLEAAIKEGVAGWTAAALRIDVTRARRRGPVLPSLLELWPRAYDAEVRTAPQPETRPVTTRAVTLTPEQLAARNAEYNRQLREERNRRLALAPFEVLGDDGKIYIRGTNQLSRSVV
jgi:hypothetical protein